MSNKYNLKTLIDEFNIFYIAGTDTTSHMLTMLIYYLIQNPSCLEKVREEINQFIKSEEDFNFDNLKKMKYIEYVQNETIRKYGPVTSLFSDKRSRMFALGMLQSGKAP